MKTNYRYCIAALALAAFPTLAAPPPIDATVSYTSTMVTRAGVTQEQRYQERLVRRDAIVWRERILPAARSGADHAHAAHREFDYEAAALWLESGAGGVQNLRFVDREDRQVVTVPAAEYRTVGYDGSWSGVASLIEPERVAAMPLSARKSAVKDAVWHEEERDGWYNRVLWSPQRQIALIVESGSQDGTQARRTLVELLPGTADAQLPWRGLQGYEQKTYDDFLD